MLHAVISSLMDFDLALFQSVNRLCGQSLTLDHLADRFESVQLKGLAFLGTFGMLWFRRTEAQTRQRGILLLTLLAIVLSVIVARLLADLLPFRQRPMFTPGIGYRAPLFKLDSYFENWSSFPSDTAAVMFSITTGFWLLSRWVGLLWVCFGMLATAARIYFGLHYPGDALVGALIGFGVTLAITNRFMLVRISAPILAVEQRAPAMVYGVLFPFLHEVSTLFSFTRSIYRSVLHLFVGYG